MPVLKQSFCIGHGRNMPIDKFYESRNPYHRNGVLPYCKDCLKDMVKDRLDKSHNLERSLWLSCADCGIPFYKDLYEIIYDKTKESKSIPNYMGLYMQRLLKYKSANDKWSFEDTDVSMGEVKTLQEKEAILESQIKEFKMLWGYEYSIEEIGYLEWRYDIYTEGKSLTEYQASRYRDLCICELRINKDPTDKNALDMKAKIANELGENQFKIDKEQSVGEQILENSIFLMEKYEPAEYYEEQDLYKDAFNIGKYWKDYVLRPIRNLVTGSKDYNVKENVEGEN